LFHYLLEFWHHITLFIITAFVITAFGSFCWAFLIGWPSLPFFPYDLSNCSTPLEALVILTQRILPVSHPSCSVHMFFRLPLEGLTKGMPGDQPTIMT
jgi:hypothetical protein